MEESNRARNDPKALKGATRIQLDESLRSCDELNKTYANNTPATSNQSISDLNEILDTMSIEPNVGHMKVWPGSVGNQSATMITSIHTQATIQRNENNSYENLKPSSSGYSAIVTNQSNSNQQASNHYMMTNSSIGTNIEPNLNLNSTQILTSEIKSLFECPICFDYATPPIYQCQNGHLVCNSCSTKINQCATCRVPVTNPSIRNLQLDRLANTFQFPCKYNFNGCDWKSYWFKKKEHEANCDFISYPCPCPGPSCKWSGLLSSVMNHLREQHKSITTLSGEDIVFLATAINLKGAVDWVMIQSCFNNHFLLVLEKQESKSGQELFYAVVQLIGSQREAQKFKYKLELGGSTSGHVRRLQWEARTGSCLDGIQASIANHDCLVFDAKMAKHFLTHIQKDNNNSGSNRNSKSAESQDENLAINVTIERYIDNGHLSID